MEKRTILFDRFDRMIRDRESVTLTELIFLALFYAKITSQIDWSWFWVLLPLAYRWLLFYFFILRAVYIESRMAKELKKEAEKFAKGEK